MRAAGRDARGLRVLAGPRGWRSGAPSCLRISTGSETGPSRSNHSARGSGKGSATSRSAAFTPVGSRSASSSAVSPPQLKLRLLLDSSTDAWCSPSCARSTMTRVYARASGGAFAGRGGRGAAPNASRSNIWSAASNQWSVSVHGERKVSDRSDTLPRQFLAQFRKKMSEDGGKLGTNLGWLLLLRRRPMAS